MHPVNANRAAIRTIAAFEAFKGLLVLLTATGLLALVHEDLGAFAARLVRHAHLNPASKYPHIFVDAATNLQHTRLLWLALGAATYSALRLVEAYGLYRERAWAEWLAALSGAIYLPFEAIELARRQNALSALALLVNVLVVVIMLRALYVRRRRSAVE